MSNIPVSLDYLDTLVRFGIKPGLSRTKKLLSKLNSPQKDYPVVLVAGTNGKGSTSAVLSSILTSNGYKTGLFTSPHLNKFNERIRINGKDIGTKQLNPLISTVRKKVRSAALKPTYFEFTTAMALKYFSDNDVDIAVVEVGMGGRLDSTNVIDPDISVITHIGKDHMKFLGTSIRDIAREKAGIIKGSPVVTAVTGGIAGKVIKDIAREVSSELYVLDKDFYCGLSNSTLGCFEYKGSMLDIKRLNSPLIGAHQAGNIGCALKVIELLSDMGFEVNVEGIREGVKKVSWPGRFEVFKLKPTVIIDSAHNVTGATALRETVKVFAKGKKITFVLGVMEDKDIKGIVKALGPVMETLISAVPSVDRAAKEEDIISISRKLGVRAVAGGGVKSALKLAMEKEGVGGTVCVAGSFFTVSEARKLLLNP
ncbi:MAG: bifunctional folylpolyglutamate synthase/dihydrofolate synthase [Deltaproteobacteria bacterium]|nr:bifunctional folylpolyglutamate synthase/dihydrofolate synthase [Deltaproteobacteria bacterium]